MTSRLVTHKLGDHELTLRVSDNVFCPTTTTQKIAEFVDLKPGMEVLDLGCGVGPLSIFCALEGAERVDSIDVVPEAVEYARENVERAGVSDRVTVYCGDLFEPVGDKKYDLIVNDVSGIAEVAARVSEWYPPAVPTGGDDGTDVVIRMLDECRNHLKPGGSLYFATSSLSAAGKIVTHANRVFNDQVERLGSYRIPFCNELHRAATELKKLADDGKVAFEQRRTRFLWTLELFRAAAV